MSGSLARPDQALSTNSRRQLSPDHTETHLILRGLLPLGLLLLTSCGGDNPTGPVINQTAGTAALASTVTEEGVYVFSFAEGKVLPPGIAAADIVTLLMRDEHGRPFGLFIGSLADEGGFALVDTYESYESALAAFDTLRDAGELPIEDIGIPVLPHQIWLVETHDAKWAKILVTDTDLAFGVNDDGDSVSVGTIGFRWVYRADGSRLFDPSN